MCISALLIHMYQIGKTWLDQPKKAKNFYEIRKFCISLIVRSLLEPCEQNSSEMCIKSWKLSYEIVNFLVETFGQNVFTRNMHLKVDNYVE